MTKLFPTPAGYISHLPDQRHRTAYKAIIAIAEAVNNVGGRALLVGGCVRDMLLDILPKDYDLEVYHLQPEQLETLLQTICPISLVGKSFGVYKLHLPDAVPVDVSLPRKDSKTGSGHQGFIITSDPELLFEEASGRRDFTINSILADPLTGEIHDPYNGLKDLEAKVLRITNPKTFSDDPLRVLRAVQLTARYNLQVETKSLEIIRQMVSQLAELSKERIREEWKKVFESAYPEVGLALAKQLDIEIQQRDQ
ncbi:MAG: hypothetical protein V1707_03015 [bacterium]